MNRALVTAIVIVGLFTGSSGVAEESDPYPLEYWALRSVINNAQVSPNGKYLGIMKIPNKTGNPIIEVYETDDLSKKPFRMDAKPMEITNFGWASDKDIVFTLRQKVRDRIDGFNQGVYETRIAVADVKKKKIRTFDEEDASVVSLLKKKPGKIIISFGEGGEDGPGAKLAEAFRPRAYWEFDLDTGSKRLIVRGKISLANINFDGAGNPWLARGFDIANGEFVWYWRKPGTGKGWTEIYRQDENSFEQFSVAELDDTVQDHILVYATNGHDMQGLWSYDVNNKRFGELIYRRADVDVYGIGYHSNSWMFPDKVTAVTYYKDKLHKEFFDETEGATYAQLEQVIPFAHNLSIVSRSRDGNTMVIRNTGPRDPGSYYLLHNGKLESIGSRQPLLESEKLADLEYITYDARDGQPISAYVTVPNGEGPVPAGRAAARRAVCSGEPLLYDEWAQMLGEQRLHGGATAVPWLTLALGWKFHYGQLREWRSVKPAIHDAGRQG